MNRYTIRRAIIKALFDFQNPQNINTIFYHGAVLCALGKATPTNADIQTVRSELNYLLSVEYVRAVPGYDDYYRLSGDIRSEIAACDPLTGLNPLRNDERLYGPEALR